MGDWSSLHLIDIRIKESSIQIVKKAFKTMKHQSNDSYKVFFERGIVDEDGFLCFKGSEEGHDPYKKMRVNPKFSTVLTCRIDYTIRNGF